MLGISTKSVYILCMKQIDKTGFGNLILFQDDEQFRYGVDAVILADFAKLHKNDVVADLCSGNGVIPFIVAHKYHCKSITGIELQKEPFELSLESLEANSDELQAMGSEIRFLNLDVLDSFSALLPESFTAITCNPPYFEDGSGINGKDAIKHIARFETTAGLEDFIKIGSKLLKDNGSFTMIHRPSRLPDIMEFMRKYGLEPKKMRFVSDKENSVPRQVLIQAIKNAGKELRIEPPLIIHGNYDGYSKELQEIYERL